jgi:hypothetical protein
VRPQCGLGRHPWLGWPTDRAPSLAWAATSGEAQAVKAWSACFLVLNVLHFDVIFSMMELVFFTLVRCVRLKDEFVINMSQTLREKLALLMGVDRLW